MLHTQRKQQQKGRMMVRLKNFQAYQTNQVPDHVLEEIHILGTKMAMAFQPIIEDTSGNIVLASLNFLMASAIKHYVADDPEQIRKAALTYANALIRNIEMLVDMKIIEE